jgi:hypothetical protein
MDQTAVDSILVISIDDMNAVAFRRHMNQRHGASLGFAGRLPKGFFEDNTDYIERCYRAFHETLHRLGVDLEHEHE